MNRSNPNAVIHNGMLMIVKETLDSGLQIVGDPVKVGNERQPDYSLETAEREAIEICLDHVDWCISRAARLLGITRATLYEKLAKYELRQPPRNDIDSDVQPPGDVAACGKVGDQPDVSENQNTRDTRWRDLLSLCHSGVH
jgi:hypothetical protein